MTYEKLKRKIGGLVKIYRAISGYTQDRLAEITDLSQQDIQNYESALTLPRLDYIIRIAEALKIPADKIFNEDIKDDLDIKELGRKYEKYNEIIEELDSTKEFRALAKYYIKNKNKLRGVNLISIIKASPKIPKGKR